MTIFWPLAFVFGFRRRSRVEFSLSDGASEQVFVFRGKSPVNYFLQRTKKPRGQARAKKIAAVDFESVTAANKLKNVRLPRWTFGPPVEI